MTGHNILESRVGQSLDLTFRYVEIVLYLNYEIHKTSFPNLENLHHHFVCKIHLREKKVCGEI